MATYTLAVFNMGGMELLLILFIVLLLFGAKRLPELAKGLGKSVKEFKKATQETEEQIHSAMNSDPKADKKPEVAAKTNGSN